MRTLAYWEQGSGRDFENFNVHIQLIKLISGDFSRSKSALVSPAIPDIYVYSAFNVTGECLKDKMSYLRNNSFLKQTSNMIEVQFQNIQIKFHTWKSISVYTF